MTKLSILSMSYFLFLYLGTYLKFNFMVRFWLIVIIVVLLSAGVGSWFDSSASEGKYKGTFFSTIAALLVLSYLLAVSNQIEIPHHAQDEVIRDLGNIPDEEQIHHFVFVESENVNIPTDVLCPYVKPVYTQTTNLDLLYSISVNSASVEYSDYYINEDNSLYRWMGNRIRKGKINSLPILSICDYEDGATIDATLYASWNRFGVFDIHRTVALKSTVFIMPRTENMTYADWKSECQAKLDSLAKCKNGWITYLSETEIHPEYSIYIKPDNIDQLFDAREINYTYQAMPQMKRTLNLRQDLYRTCNDSPLNVTDVKVSSLAEGGLIADIYFEPISQCITTNLLFQYYTNNEVSRHAYKSDCRNIRIEPGQTYVRVYVEDAYDQFAFIGFMEEYPMNMLKDNSNRYLLMNLNRDALLYGSKIELNDYSVYFKGFTDDFLRVDHRVGFWQKVFYSKYNNNLCWISITMIGLVPVALLILLVLFLRRKFKG